MERVRAPTAKTPWRNVGQASSLSLRTTRRTIENPIFRHKDLRQFIDQGGRPCPEKGSSCGPGDRLEAYSGRNTFRAEALITLALMGISLGAQNCDGQAGEENTNRRHFILRNPV